MQSEESGGPLGGQVGDQERIFFQMIAACDGFGGEVAAAHCAFHGGGPLGLGVVAGEVEVADAAGGGGL